MTAVLRANAETASDLMRAHVSVVRMATSDYVHELERAAAQARCDKPTGRRRGVSR